MGIEFNQRLVIPLTSQLIPDPYLYVPIINQLFAFAESENIKEVRRNNIKIDFLSFFYISF